MHVLPCQGAQKNWLLNKGNLAKGMQCFALFCLPAIVSQLGKQEEKNLLKIFFSHTATLYNLRQIMLLYHVRQWQKAHIILIT